MDAEHLAHIDDAKAHAASLGLQYPDAYNRYLQDNAGDTWQILLHPDTSTTLPPAAAQYPAAQGHQALLEQLKTLQEEYQAQLNQFDAYRNRIQ